MILVIDINEEDYKLALSRGALLGGMLDKKLVNAVRNGKPLSEILYTCSWEEHVNNLKGIYNETDKNKH